MTLTFAKRSSRASWPRRDRVTAYAFVAGQAVLLATVFGPARHRHRDPAARTATVLAVGSGAALATIAAAQLGRQLTALPLPTDDAQLRTTGIYGQVRHPIYTGVMLASLTRAAASGSPTRPAAAGLLAGLLNAKATWEERKLAARFPGTAPTPAAPRSSFHAPGLDPNDAATTGRPGCLLRSSPQPAPQGRSAPRRTR